MTRLMTEYSAEVPFRSYSLSVQFNRNRMVVVIKRSDSVSVLSGQVGPTDRDIWQFCIETLTVDLLIPLVQVHGVDGFTRVSVASAEKNYRDGSCGDQDLEEAAYSKG